MSFAERFGRPPELRAEAPGRVNLIGEHTDYNGGYVLPMAIPQTTLVELARRDDRLVCAWSDEPSLSGPLGYELGKEHRRGDWLDYLQGVTWALREAGRTLGGVDLRISSSVPVGSGLSSSAALAVASLRALRLGFHLSLSDVEVAMLAYRGEHDFVGVPIGVMDPMASSLADARSALFLDVRTMATERVPLPAGAAVLVIDSGVKHANAYGGYRERRRQCEQACALLGVRELRDLGEDDLGRVEALVEPLGRRARHVITENARVLRAVAAMRAGDAAELGRLFDASHRSMRDDYEVSDPDVDRLVEAARAQPGALGARLTGGGFGGAVVIVTEKSKAAAVARGAVEAYHKKGSRRATVLVGGEEAA